MTVSVFVMISMSYRRQCEALHFASRNIRWFFAVLGLLARETKRRGEPHASRSGARRCISRAPFGKLRAGFRFAPRNEAFETAAESAKKLRESALKPMKSLARVNLCAGAATRPVDYRVT